MKISIFKKKKKKTKKRTFKVNLTLKPFKENYSQIPERFNGRQKPRGKQNEVKIKRWKKKATLKYDKIKYVKMVRVPSLNLSIIFIKYSKKSGW